MSADRAVPPSEVVTFLFTDVEGSTHRWEADADAMRAALAAHDSFLRNAIEAHGGVLFKHTGDGVCAAFVSPKAAVEVLLYVGVPNSVAEICVLSRKPPTAGDTILTWTPVGMVAVA